MTDFPPLVIVLLTYQRTEYALRTISATLDNLQYPGSILWYIADDGSGTQHYHTLRTAIKHGGGRLIGGHTDRMGYGASANEAWRRANDYSEFTLWLEDDWELLRAYDPTLHITLLNEHAELGMVRLSDIKVDLHATVVGYDGYHYLRIWNESHYMFSGNPSIRHRRALEAWGNYPEGLNPGDTEVAYDYQVRQRATAHIVWPFSVGPHGVYGHIGVIKSYA